MENAKNILMILVSNYELILSSIVMILSGVIAIAILIPGEQPEKFLQAVVDFISKISTKKKPEELDK